MKNKVNSKLEWIRNFFFDSRKDGADRIGVTANYLCQIETGTKVPRLKGLCKFSYAYGIPLDILFSDERRFLIYSIEAMSALSEKSEIDKLKIMEISDMLSSLRNIFNIKAEQIAQYVGEQVKYYYHWESGYRKPKPGNLMKLANLYHVPYDLFLSGDEKYFKTTAINILIDSMNTKEKEDLVNLLLQSIMRDRNRLGPK